MYSCEGTRWKLEKNCYRMLRLPAQWLLYIVGKRLCAGKRTKDL